MSPPSHIPAVFLGYLHNLERWKKRLVLSPCVSLLSPSPVTMGPTRDQRPNSPQEAEKPCLADTHTVTLQDMPRVVGLCTRACAKPLCKGGGSPRGTYLTWGAGRASSRMDTDSFASITPTRHLKRNRQKHSHLCPSPCQQVPASLLSFISHSTG